MIKIYVNDGYLDDFDMHNKAGLLHRTVALRRKRKRSSGFCPSYECITLTGSAPMYSSKLFNSRNQSIKTFPRRPDLFSRVHYRYSEEFLVLNRSWRISTTPNTTKNFLIIFKLIQQAIMVILSCLAKKNQNLNSRKKSSVYY